ncbi:short-wave-sensitive opsin 1 [Aplysia californica]|uniref:Short-wave-sensitive opsin 1 n=1 Tax=Aplysia californica TaxID=6500 RepID=A0ABM0JDA1_APLCA|nr:short-wave-sensitive opsin 1 [Aplysia californica]
MKLIDDNTAQFWFVVLKCGFYEAFSAFGIVTNIISLVVFYRMGFRETVNVSLFGLTLSDLGSLLVLFWMGICYNPLFTYSDVEFDTLSIVYLSGGWPKLYLTRVTSWITAFVAFERCLCVAMPLKVKQAITPRIAFAVNLSLAIMVGASLPPVYATTGLDWTWFPARNKTLLGLSFTEDRLEVYDVVVGFNLFFTLGSFLIVIVCTFVLVAQLKWKTKWRQSATKAQNTNTSSRDQKISTMVTLLSALFVVCLLPSTAVFLAMILAPEFNKGKGYHNMFTIVWAVCHLFEAANSSLNIFVYTHMSSKFRRCLYAMFRTRLSVDETLTQSMAVFRSEYQANSSVQE